MKSDDNGLIILALVVGTPLFLLMEHPIIFWFIFLPIVGFGIFKFIKWLKK